MVIEVPLPYIRAVLFVTKPLERRHEIRYYRVLSIGEHLLANCRGRRPRRPRIHNTQHNVDVVRHDYVSVNSYVGIKVAQLSDVLIRDLAVWQ